MPHGLVRARHGKACARRRIGSLGMTKHDLLAYLAQVSDADASEIADALSVPYPTAAMSLLRLVRQGLASRSVDPHRGIYSYRLSDHGQARLTFFEEEQPTQSPVRGERASHNHSSPWKGASAMKRKKLHSGTYHCPACFIEFDLVAEESLKCDQCRGPLAKGSLEEVWPDEEEPDGEEGEEE